MPWNAKSHERLLAKASKARDPHRPSAHKRGYNRRWRQISKAFVVSNPYCAEHSRQGKIASSEVTDHIIPHKGDMDLFWDPSNWQALCKRCHDRKSATE